MNHMFKFIVLFVCLSVVYCYVSVDKIVKPQKPFDEKCSKLADSTSSLERCDFYKCFEERFPCGKEQWVMNWGYKYCKRFSNETFLDSFTKSGQRILNHINECLPKRLSKFYATKRAINCKILNDNAFKVYSNCYKEIQKEFCIGFPENKMQFLKSVDNKDFSNSNSISMIRDIGAKCNPKIDLLSLIFTGK